MTTLAAPAIEVRVPAPLQHQRAAYLSDARFKLLRCGRRWGKDRVAFTSAIVGHGPQEANGEPLFKGATHINPRTGKGYWIGWLVRDFPQAVGLWEEEFLPRFGGLRPHFATNKQEMTLRLPNGGGVRMVTAENVDSIRGLGKGLGGMVVNEAAHLDLAYAWKRVINWILVDNAGWAILMSTTNSGLDGNAEKTAPSFFNRLCLEQKSGAKSAEWAQFTGTGDENTALDAAAIAEARSELAAGSLEEREEWYAELVPPGSGLAFPQWDPSVHLAPHQAIPSYWRFSASMDWGLRAPSVVHLTARGADGEALWCREWTWTDKDAYDAGYDLAVSLLHDDDLPGWPEGVWCDSAMNERTGVGGKTILGEFQSGIDDARAEVAGAPPLMAIPVAKGPGSRRIGYNLMTRALAWGPRLADGSLPPSRRPTHRILLTRDGRPTCPMLAKELATLPLDPKDNTDVDTTQSDHAFDSAKYGEMGWQQGAARPVADVPQHVHPGFLPNGQRRSRDQGDPAVRQQEMRIVYEHAAEQRGELAGRYGRRPRNAR